MTKNANPKATKQKASATGRGKPVSAKRQTAKRASVKKPSKAPAPPKVTKRDQLAGLLVRDEGATIDQMTKATSWLPHTVRAAMTGLRKHGYAIDSDKIDGVRTYRAVAPE